MKKYHYIYKITNTINGKYYIGRHSTDDINDGYMGSGVAIKKAILKYGKSNFIKEILEYAETFESLIELELTYVNHDTVLDEMSYNMTIGGLGGTIEENWDQERKKNHSLCMSVVNNREEKKKKTSETVSSIHSEKGKDYWSEDGFSKMLVGITEKNGAYVEWSDERRQNAAERMSVVGKTAGKWARTDENNEKTSESRKGKGCGDRNGMKQPEAKEKIKLARTGTKKMILQGISSKFVKPEEFKIYLDLGYQFADSNFVFVA